MASNRSIPEASKLPASFTPAFDALTGFLEPPTGEGPKAYVSSLVFGAIYRFAQDTGACTASTWAIAKRAGVSQREVRRALEVLETMTLVTDTTPDAANRPHRLQVNHEVLRIVAKGWNQMTATAKRERRREPAPPTEAGGLTRGGETEAGGLTPDGQTEASSLTHDGESEAGGLTPEASTEAVRLTTEATGLATEAVRRATEAPRLTAEATRLTDEAKTRTYNKETIKRVSETIKRQSRSEVESDSCLPALTRGEQEQAGSTQIKELVTHGVYPKIARQLVQEWDSQTIEDQIEAFDFLVRMGHDIGPAILIAMIREYREFPRGFVPTWDRCPDCGGSVSMNEHVKGVCLGAYGVETDTEARARQYLEDGQSFE